MLIFQLTEIIRCRKNSKNILHYSIHGYLEEMFISIFPEWKCILNIKIIFENYFFKS